MMQIPGFECERQSQMFDTEKVGSAPVCKLDITTMQTHGVLTKIITVPVIITFSINDSYSEYCKLDPSCRKWGINSPC